MMAPCGQTTHFLAKNQREREQEEKTPWSHPLQGSDVLLGHHGHLYPGTHTHMHADTHAHIKIFFFNLV